ncbi:hypothetical protein L1277_002397 [Okibacterium sp. HSC-33S16]|nr:hypothetical protein [Okibacterium sp. HSC-33S16]
MIASALQVQTGARSGTGSMHKLRHPEKLHKHEEITKSRA